MHSQDRVHGAGDDTLPDHALIIAQARADRAATLVAAIASLIARARSYRLGTVVVLAAVNATMLVLYAHTLPAVGVSGLSLPVLLAIFLASALSSIAGFAFSAICGALLFHLLDEPVRIVQIMIVCSIAIQALSVWALRRAVDWRALPPFLAGGLLSLPLGVWLLLHARPHIYAQVIGALLVLYGGFMLFHRPIRLRHDLGGVGDAVAGLLGGITGGFAGFPGALVTIWCGAKGWDKRRQRGVYQPFILFMQIAALVTIRLMQQHGAAGIGPVSWAYVPAALLGTWCGLTLFARLTDRQFAVAVNVLLIASGIGLTGG